MAENGLRLGYVMGRFPVLSETFIGNEIRTIKSLGHHIQLFALKTPQHSLYQPEDEDLKKLCHYLPPYDAVKAKDLTQKFRQQLPSALPFLYQQKGIPTHELMYRSMLLAQALAQKNCQHVHAHFSWDSAAHAIVAAKLLGISCSFTCHGSDVYRNPIDLPLKCSQADMVIAVSPLLHTTIQSLTHSTHIHTLYCGINTQYFVPCDRGDKHARWLYFGRLVECKGVDDLIDAWALIPEDVRPQLDIAGDGELKEALQSKVKQLELGSYITFLGPVQSQWLTEHAPHYQGAVFPFRKAADNSQDTFPQTVKEALSMGLPVITTNIGDLNKLLDKSGCFMVPYNDSKALAQKVIEIAQMSQQKRQEICHNGRDFARQHVDVHAQASKLCNLFQHIIQQPTHDN